MVTRALDIDGMGWSPLAGGLLTGKYPLKGGAGPAAGSKSRLESAPCVPFSERNLAIAAEVTAVANEVGASPSQVALAGPGH